MNEMLVNYDLDKVRLLQKVFTENKFLSATEIIHE